MNLILKKTLFISVIVILTLLVGCKEESEIEDIISNKSEKDLTDTTFEWEEEYTEPDYSIYSKSASDNKLDYSKIYIKGQVLEVNPVSEEGLYTATVKDRDGNKWLFGYGEDDFLLKGESYSFYGVYIGVSNVLNELPTIIGTRLIYEDEYVPVLYQDVEVYEAYEGYTMEQLQEQYRFSPD